MKFSIITPCYNSENFIEETIESVLAQRGDFEIEYLIVDGGSTDRTLGIIREYKKRIESGEILIKCHKVCLMYLSEKDESLYDALAKGFRLITGEVVAYVNSDDFYFPNAFSTVAEIFGKHPDVKWLTGMITGCNERGQIIDCLLPFRFDKGFIQKGICGTILPFIEQESTFWKRKLVDDLDLDLLKKHKFAGDFYLWYTFSKSADLYIVHSCLGGFRNRPGQISKEKDKYFEEFHRIAEKKGFKDVIMAYLFKGVTYFIPNIIKRALAKNMIYFDGSQWIKKGRN